MQFSLTGLGGDQLSRFGQPSFIGSIVLGVGVLVSTGVSAQVPTSQNRSSGEFVPERMPGSTVISNRPRATAAQFPPFVQPGQLGSQTTSGLVPSAPVDSGQRLQGELISREKLGFQDFVLQTTGRELPLFGAELFQNSPSTFAPLDNIPVTPDYVIGPGDEIVIRAWGQIEIDFSGVVDRSGTLSLPKVGVLNVAGIKYQDLSGFLKTAVGRTFRNFELTASLGRLRSMQIFVVGQAKRPGTYTVSSLSTLVTALFASGGPSAKGSMRAIQLKRGNKVITEFDLYDLLVSGDKSMDAQLLPGDVIYIPPVGQLAAINGSINVPAIYEIKQDASLSQLLRWAGGLSTTAEGQKITIERIVDRKVRKVEEFPLTAIGLSHAVRDGDLVTVYALLPRFENAITLQGQVGQPGRFPWTPSMRISDLIPSKESLISRDYVLNRDKILDGSSVGQGAAIQATKSVNQIRPLRNEINWDYAVIERIRQDDLRSTLIPFNLGKAVLEGDVQHNLILQPGDVITIFSNEDIRISEEKRARFVRLEGEFMTGGIYQILPGETLRQLIARIGGFTPSAYLFGAEFTRESTRLQQQKNLDEALSRLERDLQRVAATRAQNAIAAEDANSLKEQVERQQALVGKLRALRPTGRIVLGLSEAASLKDLPELPLEDGDRLFVPSPPSMVTVFGAVYNENAYVYRPEMRAQDYLALAGGPTKDADASSTYVLRVDGSVVSRRQTGPFASDRISALRVMPGDSIVVPEELDKTSFMRNVKDIAQIFYQVGLGAAAIKVLRQ